MTVSFQFLSSSLFTNHPQFNVVQPELLTEILSKPFMNELPNK
jgi:hypothetical protein